MEKIEGLRRKVAKRFLHLKITRHDELQGIVEMAAEICQAPIAMITLTDGSTEFIKFKVGIDMEKTRCDDNLCRQVIEHGKPVVIPDLHETTFTAKSYSKGKTNTRSYAGIPIITNAGLPIGTLCVLDTKPKYLTDKQLKMLDVMARQAISIMELELNLSVLKTQYTHIRESENKLRSFFESSASCYFLLDADMRITAFNKTAAKFVKAMLNMKLVPGILMTDHIKRVDFFKKNFDKALSGKLVKTELEVPYQNGTVVWWSIVYEPAYDTDGNIIGVSYNATDITEAKNNELKVFAQNEVLRNIAFVQSHELRKPVASIMGLVYLIRLSNYQPDQEHLEMLEQATAELDEKIHTIINQVELN
jgi:PAS domain S-box-containing protein